MSAYLERTSQENKEADISLILDAACYTSAETAEEVCDLLRSTIDHLHKEMEEARKKGAGWEYFCVPDAYASAYRSIENMLNKKPGFRMVDNRTQSEKDRSDLARSINSILLYQTAVSSVFENDLREKLQRLCPSAHERTQD